MWVCCHAKKRLLAEQLVRPRELAEWFEICAAMSLILLTMILISTFAQARVVIVMLASR